MLCGMRNSFVALWKEEWLENLREAGEGYKRWKIFMKITVMQF